MIEENPFLEASLLGSSKCYKKSRGRSRSKLFKTDYISIENLLTHLRTLLRD